MKYKLILGYFLGLFWIGINTLTAQVISQKVGINPTIIQPSAALEIESTTKGLLLPRLTFTQRNAIVSPVSGLVLYCTDCGISGELQVFNGSTWTNSTGNAAKIRTCKAPTSNGGFLVFMCHNLGADYTADPFTPSWKLNGAYFQWGKKPVDTNGNGYFTKPNNGSEGFVAAPIGPGAGQANDSAIASWSTSAAVDGAWNVTEGSPLKTANDPCPSGYRLPTRNEWLSIYNTTPINTQANWSNMGGSSWNVSTTNYSTGKKINNSLYLPASGYISYSDPVMLSNRGGIGVYWSSTESGSNALYFSFNSFSVTPSLYSNRLFGFSVRCVEE